MGKTNNKVSQSNFKLLGTSLIIAGVAIAYSAFYIVTNSGDKVVDSSIFRQGATTLLNHCVGVCNQVATNPGDIVISYNGDIMVSGAGSWQGNDFLKEKSKNVNIPAGEYTVKLESYDNFVGRDKELATEQSQEQYYVIFKDGNQELDRTGTTKDLKDGVEEAGNITFTNKNNDTVSFDKNVNKITVVHAGPSSQLLKHGFEPVCMLLERVEAGVAKIQILKRVNKSMVKSGETVVYSYEVKNIGETTLTDVEVVDDKLGDITCPKTTLAVNEVMNCADKSAVINDAVTNVAIVTGNDPNNKEIRAQSYQIVDIAPASCGDGHRDSGEQCDDGNTTNGDGCSSACQIEASPTCGDGHRDSGEECDDGNTKNGDGCSASCKKEKKKKKDDCDASIGNYIWYDTNGNGVQEDIEEGIEGIKVCAYDGNDKECDTTNSSGKYKIKDLCAHTYTVIVKGVGEMVQTYDPDGKKDNKTTVKLKNGDKHTKADFGYRGAAPATGLTTNIALLIGISTLITIGILMVMKKKGAL